MRALALLLAALSLATPAVAETIANPVAAFSGLDKITGRITSFDGLGVNSSTTTYLRSNKNNMRKTSRPTHLTVRPSRKAAIRSCDC